MADTEKPNNYLQPIATKESGDLKAGLVLGVKFRDQQAIDRAGWDVKNRLNYTGNSAEYIHKGLL